MKKPPAPPSSAPAKLSHPVSHGVAPAAGFDPEYDFDEVAPDERFTLGFDELRDAWRQFRLRRSVRQ